MFFTDREKAIYTTPDGRAFDPLRVLHLLTVATGNRLSELVSLRNPDTQAGGDVSAGGRSQAAVEAARAEMQLADAARTVFGFGPFESGVTDAAVLETLYHYLEWLEGKDYAAGTPP